jgi:hypothetical protein
MEAMALIWSWLEAVGFFVGQVPFWIIELPGWVQGLMVLVVISVIFWKVVRKCEL